MIEVAEAVKIVQQSILHLPTTVIPLEKALGRVLREQVTADSDFPPFDRVMMDGIAIRYEAYKKGVRTYVIEGVQPAGAPQLHLGMGNVCLEVMTGAVAPKNADLVVPYEDITIDQEKRTATVHAEQLNANKNIHKKGTDKQRGDVLLNEGIVLEAPEIAVAASVGKTSLKVTKNPRVAIISTGDELVEIDAIPLPHQIRRSNAHALSAELMNFGIKSDLFHFNDERKKLTIQLKKVLDEHDVIIMSGGVSKGKFDFVPEALKDLGVTMLFHRIKQKPGKPFWFGTGRNKKVVFAFPGNPVSTFLCYHKYFVPWLKKSLGMDAMKSVKAILTEDFYIKTSLTYFLQVEAKVNENGQLTAKPKMGKGSGDHANLLVSNAFLELPGNTFDFKKGEVFNLVSFRKG